MQLTDQATGLAEYAAQALATAELLRVKTKVVDGFPLDEHDRATAAAFESGNPKLRRKLAKPGAAFSITILVSVDPEH